VSELYQVVDSVPFVAVREMASGRDVATFGAIAPLGQGHRERAEVYAAHLNREHADGRVPQSTCSQLEAPDPANPKAKPPRLRCDFDRVNEWRNLTAAQRCTIILCEHHEGRVPR